MQKSRTTEGVPKAEDDDAEKKGSKENQLKRTKSRELRGGIMYYSCHCIKRNGLQHDCRRTGCGGEPTCLVLPDPLCAPSQLARARGLADPAPLADHLRAQGGTAGNLSEFHQSSGKRFIVCELKGLTPDVSSNKPKECCKFPLSYSNQINNHCCKDFSSQSATKSPLCFIDEQSMKTIIKRIQNKELPTQGDQKSYIKQQRKDISKEPCTRPGCVHWKPPSPCLWDLPCKADCFEIPINKPDRYLINGNGSSSILGRSYHGGNDQNIVTLNSIK